MPLPQEGYGDDHATICVAANQWAWRRGHARPPESELFIPRAYVYPSNRVSSVPAIIPPAISRTFWQRRIRDPIVAQLTQGISPEKIALTLSVGSAVAVFPILGTSTILCFLAALALRLNQPITQLINQACWPVHVPVIYLCIRVGEKLFGTDSVQFDLRSMSKQVWNNPAQFFHDFGPSALHALVAWFVLAPFYIGAVYAISLPIMRAVNRMKAEAAAKARAAEVADHPVP